MGMPRMFSDDAEFDDLFNETLEVFVSKVVHKAVFKIDEEGAEGAATTG